MDLSILEKLGLTSGEVKVYLALLKLGTSSTGPIAKVSGVSISKVYIILDKLEKKGLSSHVEKSGVAYFSAVEPEKVKDYIKEKKDEINELEKQYELLLPKLQSFYQKEEDHKVNVYVGLKGMKVAHGHLYLKLKKGDEYVILGTYYLTESNTKKYWLLDHERREKKGIKCRILFNTSSPKEVLERRNKFRFCDARYMPIDINSPAYFLIYADTTVIHMISEKPLSIEIVSKEIADAFRIYFETFWKKSKPLK